jgi:predicted GNAT family N-acyltransferase
MSTEIITHLRPPGASISTYNPNEPPTAQGWPLPQPFLDAMAVRTVVFVCEQGVEASREQDDDDARSHHWVVYAPANSRPRRGAADGPPWGDVNVDVARNPRDRSASTAAKLPVGTIRAVPPDPPGCVGNGSSGSCGRAHAIVAANPLPHPTVHRGEPYVRLGRLATVPEFRGHGLGKLLVATVLQFLREHGAAEFIPQMSTAEMERRKLADELDEVLWKGLVVVHAQRDRTVDFWRRFGFEVDEGMGEWDEEGMMHVGMWKRVELIALGQILL